MFSVPEDIHFVHYLPLGSTIISAVFVAALLSRASKRRWAPHLVWWAIGIFFYGLGTGIESVITLDGNTEFRNRLWYWAGAILGGYPLGTGSAYLLLKRRWAHALTAVTLPVVIVTSVLVFIAPMHTELLQSHRPTGRGIFEWKWLPWTTPFINIYAALMLVGGALWSCARFAYDGNNPMRALGTGLIAIGGLLPGIGGAMTKAGHVEWLYVGEFFGIIFITAGYWVCIKAPAPVPCAGELSSRA